MKAWAVLRLLAFGAPAAGAARNIYRVDDDLKLNESSDGLIMKESSLFIEDSGFWERFLTGDESMSMSMSVGPPAMPLKPPAAPIPSAPSATRPSSPASPVAQAAPSSATVPVVPPSAVPVETPTIPPVVQPPTDVPVEPPVPATEEPSIGPMDSTAPSMSPVEAPTIPTVTPSSPPISGPTPTSTLGDVVLEGEEFGTLEALLVATSLLTVLDTPDLGATLFAPVDDAFLELDPDLVDKLLDAQWVDHAACVLSYHVVGSVVASGDLEQGQTLQTLEGGDATVTSIDPPTINDAEVIEADILASNGVAHSIGGVLLSVCVTETVLEYLSSNPEYSTLVSLLGSTGLDELLNTTDSPFTIFAPTNTAFERTSLTVIAADEDLLRVALLSHVFLGNLYANILVNADGVIVTEDIQEHTAFLNKTGGDIPTVNRNVGVTEPDILRSDGVVHAVDEVIIPLFIEDLVLEMERFTEVDHSFTLLARALEAAKLLDLLGLQDSFEATLEATLFAPSNDVLVDHPLTNRLLDDEWFYHNQELLLRHLSSDVVLSVDQLIEAGTVIVASDETLTISEDGVIDDTAAIVEEWSDIRAVNGFVQSIDDILIPPFQLLTIMEFIELNDSLYSTLKSLVEQTGLDEPLSGEGPFTLLGPTNDAFAAMGINPDTTIAEEDLDGVRDLLLYHVLAGNGVFIEWEDGQELETLNGASVTFTTTVVPEPRFFINGVELERLRLVENGVFYAIEEVLALPMRGK